MKIQRTMTLEEEAAWLDLMRHAQSPDWEAIAQYNRWMEEDRIHKLTAVPGKGY